MPCAGAFCLNFRHAAFTLLGGLERRNALRASAAALLFGAIQALVPQLLSSGLNVPVYFIEMSPYLATLAYLVLAGMFAKGADARPVDLGRPYLREERRRLFLKSLDRIVTVYMAGPGDGTP